MKRVKSLKAYCIIFTGYSDVVNVKDVCSMLKVCEKTVYRLIRSGKLIVIPGMKPYRFAKLHIIDYVLNGSKEL